ncbi:MAG: ABC transporter ATP-binding protein [Candidatus Eremiobacteraeota bacterium]|nr:ABC transporter ATP-binding protein [Candidatus Eremiobacteraeota bacterium]
MNSPAGAPVRFERVSVRYSGSQTEAVDAVAFDVRPGEFVVLLGPSGCGKSTLLRTVNRLVVPNAGRVLVGDKDTATLDAVQLRRRIGYVIQAVGLFSHMTVAQNVAVVPSLLHWDRARIDARIDELLHMVRLDPARYRDRFPKELSGGEQQRVGVARALAAEPEILLMDEPFAAVDAIVRHALQDEIAEIARRLGTTVLFVTHDVDEALRLAARIAILERGRLVQYDAPLRILTAPAAPFVESLLDTHDVVRRLSLKCARDAMQPPRDGAGPDVREDVSLREILNDFLRGAATVHVLDGNARRIGSLSFGDVVAAVASS